ncbi:MAG: adenylyl-sulfate kinase [Nitrospinota bacterium]|nr:adenylyl-sulfate kinase [Nitrospinota bacterium]MDH5757397.1 adenylyl-sulfate kinase [Nitrospinota bacterium]
MDKKADNKATNVVWHHATVTRERREKKNKHRSAILWFTGLPCSGKSTLSHAVEESLFQMGCNTFVLDGDNVRHGLCSNLGFTAEDRTENIRRIGELAKLFLEAGVIPLTAFISPYIKDRELARNLVPHGDFIEIYCDSPLEVCEERDVKGLYKKARSGEIKHYTGVSDPYEAPVSPEARIDTANQSVEKCAEDVIDLLISRGIIDKPVK